MNILTVSYITYSNMWHPNSVQVR